MIFTYTYPLYVAIVLLLLLGILIITSKVKFQKKKTILFFRSLSIIGICIALAAPFYVGYIPQWQQYSVTVLVDNSTSMQYLDVDIPNIIQQIRAPITLQTIAQGSTSPLVQQIYRAIEPQQHYLIISDGHATDQNSYASVIQKAQQLDARLHVLQLPEYGHDASVSIVSPHKTQVGAQTPIQIQVHGNIELVQHVTVSINGQTVLETQDIQPYYDLTQVFYEEQTITIEAHIQSDDDIAQNNVFYKTIPVVQKASIVYIGTDTPTLRALQQIFDVTHTQQVPQNLSAYTAVVAHNVPASLLEQDNLIDFVVEGNGLFLLGGTQSFDLGGYDSSSIAPLVPVTKGISGDHRMTSIVIVLDISVTTGRPVDEGMSGMEIGQQLAYNIVRDLGEHNRIAIVAFDTEPYIIQPLTVLGPARLSILDKISRIQNQGATRLHRGLRGGYELIEQASGNRAIIFISDGLPGGDNDGGRSIELARMFGAQDIQLFTVGVGQDTNDGLMRQLAMLGNGQYIEPQQTDILTIEFGKDRGTQLQSQVFGISAINENHPITRGIQQSQAVVNNVNLVVPKRGAQLLATTTQGDTALTVWQYGLGRVATWNAFQDAQALAGFVQGGDAVLFMRTASWVSGDPERVNPRIVDIADGRVDNPTTIRVHAPSIASFAQQVQEDIGYLQLQKIDEQQLLGHLSQTQQGIHSLFGQLYAMNYPLELQHIGQHPVMQQVAEQTQAKYLKVDELDALIGIMQSHQQQTNVSYPIAFIGILLAMICLLLEIMIRKIGEYKQ
ncbi:MAG: VWA domain-containing protein [Candidatus Woesearchaeota archaeon]